MQLGRYLYQLWFARPDVAMPCVLGLQDLPSMPEEHPADADNRMDQPLVVLIRNCSQWGHVVVKKKMMMLLHRLWEIAEGLKYHGYCHSLNMSIEQWENTNCQLDEWEGFE